MRNGPVLRWYSTLVLCQVYDVLTPAAGYANGVIGSGASWFHHRSHDLLTHISSSQYLYVARGTLHLPERSPFSTVLTRIYGKAAVSHHNYSTTLSSVAFAGTIVGMLSFGYMSDKFGRKFGMVRNAILRAHDHVF